MIIQIMTMIMMIIMIIIILAIIIMMIKIILIIAVVIITNSPFEPGDFSTGSTTDKLLIKKRSFYCYLLTDFTSCLRVSVL